MPVNVTGKHISSWIGDRLIIILFRYQEFRCNDAGGIDQQHSPAHRAKDPGFAQLPANLRADVL